MPFSLPVINQIPFVRFLGDSDWIRVVTLAFILAIAALGLNVLTGMAGQVSLGHAFFMGVGAYTAAVVGGQSGGDLLGMGLPIWLWLPAAGMGAAVVGLVVAPVAVRLRGLYLAIVTLRSRVHRHPPGQHVVGSAHRRRPRGSAASSPASTSACGKRNRRSSTSRTTAIGSGSTSRARRSSTCSSPP